MNQTNDEKVKKPWYKRWWAITLFVFLGLGVIGSFMDSSEQPQRAASTAPSVSSFTGSPTDLLPTRAELPTEFKIDKTVNFTLNKSGFISGEMLSTSKIEGSSGVIVVEYLVSEFASSDAATAWYNERVNGVKEEGGYTEISVPGCFAFKVSYGFVGTEGETRCLYDNLVYVVAAVSTQTFERIDGFMKDGVSLIKKKLG